MGSPASTLLAVGLFLVGLNIGIAQPLFCGGENKCLADAHSAHLALPHSSRKQEPTDAQQCPATRVEVSGASSVEYRAACAAADTALQLLGRCNLVLKRPLRVAVESEVDHPHPQIGLVFGVFDPIREQIRIARPASISALAGGTPFAALSIDDLYESIIVHEIVHGVMHQHQRRPVTSQALYEYLAYALQIESMPPAARNRFLEALAPATYAHELLFNDLLLFMNPHFFAASAYKHFSAALDRCAILQSLLEGEATFIVNLPRL